MSKAKRKAKKGLKQWGKLTKLVSQAIVTLESGFQNELDEIAEELLEKELLPNFDQGKDPYSKRWKKRKHSYSHPILNKTGKMRNSFTYKAPKNILKPIKFQNTASYSGYHQSGTKHMAQRKLFPEGKLPKSWNKTITKHIIKRFKKLFNLTKKV